ncbi:HD-GYP domain-containing protein [Pseudoduganella danionis]|uniref:HD-GYP domain-containing protein n=1 Tax=Pseudoduganella danionis TaxID=1890295 RepID=UPI0035B288D9
MNIRKVTAADLHLGMPMPWNVYGENGDLMVRKGHMLASVSQISSLVAQGVYEDYSGQSSVPASAVRKLNAAGQQLAVLLPLIEHGTAPQDVLARLETVAGLVAKAVAVDADVAVAAILHNQQDLPYSIRHSLNSAIIVHLLGQARQLAQPEVRSLTLAALTMNVGMLAQHQRLQDCSEELCSSDRAMVLHHCERSVELLRAAGIDDARWLECVLHHHENEDGSGYPLRKAGAQIPPLARLLALADRYCARVSERAYRKTMAPNLALRDLLLDANVTVDGNLAPMLIRALGIYPVGTYVRLLNGEVAVVARRGLQSTTPQVETVLCPRSGPLARSQPRDTRSGVHGIRDALTTAQAAALQAPPLRMEQLWGGRAAA